MKYSSESEKQKTMRERFQGRAASCKVHQKDLEKTKISRSSVRNQCATTWQIIGSPHCRRSSRNSIMIWYVRTVLPWPRLSAQVPSTQTLLWNMYVFCELLGVGEPLRITVRIHWRRHGVKFGIISFRKSPSRHPKVATLTTTLHPG